MRTIQTVMHQLTDAKSITKDIKETLRKTDPVFSEKEARFLNAASALEQKLAHTVFPSVNEYLAAMEEKYVFSVIYIGWQGFQLNLDIFHNPVNALRLKEDYENLHQERRLETLSVAQPARGTIDSFCDTLKKLPEDCRSLTDEISDYYAYLETTGYKLAHYFGFLLADQFLPHVIPGYISDEVHTSLYTMELQEYLDFSLDALKKECSF